MITVPFSGNSCVLHCQFNSGNKDVHLNISPVQQMQLKKRTKLTCPYAFFFHTHGHLTGSHSQIDLEPLHCACLSSLEQNARPAYCCFQSKPLWRLILNLLLICIWCMKSCGQKMKTESVQKKTHPCGQGLIPKC